jgi:hypothetical protein
MFFSHDRNQLRQQYFDVWHKMQNNQLLSPLENQIAKVIEQHPEYHPILQEPDKTLTKDFSPERGETNPFLHMSLHLSLRDQLDTNRPKGIRSLFRKACQQTKDPLAAEHLFMDALVEMIWEIQRYQASYSDEHYLQLIKTRLAQ